MKRLLVGAAALLLVLSSFLATQTASAQRTGGMVDLVSWFPQPNSIAALSDLETGAMDIYMVSLRTAADVAAAKANPSLWTIDTAGGSYNNLLVNPVPVNQSLAPGGTNPFAKQPVREALNFLVNREFIIREVAPGNTPMYTFEPRVSAEYTRDAGFFFGMEATYAFAPLRARDLIFNALNTDPDYSFVNYKWFWRGAPVVLKFVIRTEDLRRDVGEHVAMVLEGYGFGVERVYRTGGGAIDLVYNGPPDTGEWHLYTEGWAATAGTRWADGDPYSYCAGGSGGRLWALYSPPQALRDVSTRLFEGNYSDLTERQQLFREAVRLCTEDAVRVWLVDGAGTFAISRRVTGLVYDLWSGPRGLLATRTARFATAGGSLQVGQGTPFLSPWNPWRGFGWLYDQLQTYAFADPPLWPHPHTGLYMPIRAAFDVTTVGPTGTWPVPATALTWDPVSKALTASVGPGVAATSRIVFTWTFGQWHDGSTFDMDDVLYDYALMFRRANATAGDVYAEDDEAASAGVVLLTRLIKGLEVSGNSLTVYLDYSHIDPGTIAAAAVAGDQQPVGPVVPWTAAELALSTVLNDGPCSIDEVTAGQLGKSVLDLTKGDCLAAMDRTIGNYTFGRHRPPGFDTTTLPDAEVDAEWRALWAFRNTTGHYLPSIGPFQIASVDPVAMRTSMVRDPNYPFEANRYDAFLVPKVPEISFAPTYTVIIGRPASFIFTSSLPEGTLYDRISASWFVVDPSTGSVLLEGLPARVGDGLYQIALTEDQTRVLQPAAYELRMVVVGEEAMRPTFVAHLFIAIPDLDTAPDLYHLLDQLNQTIRLLEQQLSDQRNATVALQLQVAAAQATAAVGIGVGIAGIAAGVAGLAIGVRTSRGARPPQIRRPPGES